MEYKLVVSDFIKDELNSDERYNSYRLTVPIKIFQYTLMDDDLEEFELYVSKKILLQDIIYKINEYINWLQNFEQELKKYYEKQLHETVNKNWFNELEIYNVSITFDDLDDYGATISCGDNILSDHILEFDFEKNEIIDVRMNG